MTDRLYYNDSYLTSFRGRIVDRDESGRKVYLDRSAFYPASGGQPADRGAINGVSVIDVIDEGDRVAHLLSEPVEADEIEGQIDWQRRFDYMQQHSGQHLLSAVLQEMFGLPTVSFHLGEQSSTIDIAAPSLDPEQVKSAERRANDIVFENRPLSVEYCDSSEAKDLRKPSERTGVLRIVSIQGLDRSACGGTHVRSTGEIGPIFVRKLDRVRGNVRIEFLCGGRAIRRAREDFELLSKIARTFSSSLDETASLVAAQQERLAESEKARRRLANDLALLQGRELYDTASEEGGVRYAEYCVPAGGIDEAVRTLAQSFTSRPAAVFLATSKEPLSILLAASDGSPVHVGEVLKSALTASGGRGGGNARMAQGSVPSAEALQQVVEEVRATVRKRS